ncbi:hypothetical protein CRE_03884 [Caenorhabditis remanei]|uniref:UBR-type domain-containing protein n=1 Tax=Caenorhabditis remanei TaxID=31234 RepID=E3LXN4_CAERE|nr:hypothetical protein CRE_03884 [Caenorhabditis remanei]
MNSRRLAIGLARYVQQDTNQEVKGEIIAAFIYRLRVVVNCEFRRLKLNKTVLKFSDKSKDVDEICEAMRILIQRLVDLPPVTFAPEVWMPLMAAISEGGIEPQWRMMMETVDVSSLPQPTEPNDPESDFEDEIDLQLTSSPKYYEQITSICKEFVLKYGLTRRVFAAILGTDLSETMEKMIDQKWDSLKIQTSNESASQASYLMERNIFDVFSEMKDHEMFAKELFYASLARILKRLQEHQKPSQDSEDVSFYESSFQIFDEVLKKMWPYLSKTDSSIKKNSMKIFEKLLSICPNNVLVQKLTEKFVDTCGWLKISAEDICEEMEPRLWKVIGSLVARLLDLKKTIPYEIDYAPDDFEALCEQPPGGSKKEMFLRSMVDATRASLLQVLIYLRTSKCSSDVVQFMRDYYSELVFSQETLIMHASIDMFRESTFRDSIKSEDILSIVDSIIDTPAIVSMVLVICGIKDIKTAKQALEKTLIRMANDLEDEDQKREGYVNHLHESSSFWACVAKYADRNILDKAAKRFVEVAIDSPDIRTATLSADIFLTILKLELVSDAEKLPEDAVICNAQFSNWDMEESRFRQVGNKLVECNMAKRPKYAQVPLFTLQHLQEVDSLPMRDLIYTVTLMQFLKTKEGMELHKQFYENYPGLDEIFENFQSREHKIRLCSRLLGEFAKIVSENEKGSLIFSLDHENVLNWLEEIGIIDSPIISEKLIDLTFHVEVWHALNFLQFESTECHFDDVQTFGRIWMTNVMEVIPDKTLREVEDQITIMLRNQYEKQGYKMKALREKRFNGKFPKYPKPEPLEPQILSMHNRIGIWLTKKKVEEFADESTKLFTWLIGVCSGQKSYGDVVTAEAKKILAKLYPDQQKQEDVKHYFGMAALLNGIGKCKEEEGKFSFRPMFIRIYQEVVSGDMTTWEAGYSMEVISKRLGGFHEWLEDVNEEKIEKDNGHHLQVIQKLSHHCWFKLRTIEVAELDNTTPDHILLTLRKFSEVITSRMDKIINWLIPTLSPFTLASRLDLLLEIIFLFPEIVEKYRKQIESYFFKLFDLFLKEEYIDGLVNNPEFKIQTTDKYLSSTLNTKREYYLKDPTQNKLFRVPDLLMLISKYGSQNVQIHCLKKIGEALAILPGKILENQEVLRGNKNIEENSEKRVACDVIVLSEFLGYFNCLYSQISMETPSEPSEETIMKTFMLLDTGSRSKNETNKRKTSSGLPRHHQDHIDMKYCTFKSTGNKFTSQHWYNCYTCNMMESTGVCSTCAVNCHRGHELAYSKKGAFFCDCGSKPCAAMKGADHYPNAMNSLRGQFPDNSIQKTSPKPRDVFVYFFEFLKTKDDDYEELKNSLKAVQKEFQKAQNDLEKVLESIEYANRKALNVTEHQRSVVESMKNMDRVVLEEKEEFMSPLDAAGHFLPIRGSDSMVQDRGLSITLRQRELADIIKLDDGTELLVMIPDSVQSCLQLHYMDTRTHLLQGMHCLRTETEQIPFSPVSLDVSGNRLVVCGTYEIYALRFSPQGTVIDRAHIKLLENGSSGSMNGNPVKKARFCPEIEGDTRKKQLIAVATMQYIRVYDLTLHETNFVEEMVLTTGNVEDVLILNPVNGNIRVLVLSSSGYLYEHNISDCTADNNSIFLTNVVNTPGMDMNGDGVSLHYSSKFNLLFVSLDSALYVARLPEPTGNSQAPIYDWKPMNIKWPVEVWREASGIIACLSKEITDQVMYFHPTVDKIMIQKTQVNRPIMTFFMMTSSKNQSIYSVMIFPNLPTCEIWESSWENVHDLWIADVPSERFAIEVVEQKMVPKPLDKEDLVLLAEQCEPIGTVEWSCRDIEMFYTHTELNHRLSISESMPITVVQQTHFTLTARVTNSRQIVRMIRLEVEGPTGPEYLKIGNTRYTVSTRNAKVYDLRLTREESLTLDHRNITIEVIPKTNQNTVKLKSLKLYGCDRNAMDEIQPRFERQPVLNTPNRLVYSILEFPGEDVEWVEKVAESHLSRKLNHPSVCSISTKSILKCHPKIDEKLFQIIDRSYLQEWKSLVNWTEESGFSEMRMHHVEHLLDRMEAVRTRWPYFYQTLKQEFGAVTCFVELMRDEMGKMPLHRCQMMAQAIVKVVFGMLSYGTDESEKLIHVFLDIFTDNSTYHLANDLRSAVQETFSRYDNVLKQEKQLIEGKDKNELIRIGNTGLAPFYGAPRVLAKTPANLMISNVTGTLPLEEIEKTTWLDQIISLLLEKLSRSKSTSTWQNISDSPAYNLSRVLASCVAICDPKIIGSHFSRLIRLISYDANEIYPFSEKTFPNYSLLRSVELLLFVCLEKRGEEKKENLEMLDSIVNELQTVGIRDLCFNVLEKVIPEWKERGPATFSRNSSESHRKVWLPHVPLVSSSANPSNANVMNWPSSLEDAYIIACTDLVLLIPQHLQELDRRKSVPRDDRWIQKLCQLANLSNGCSAYRQCKKLLLAMCYNDETKYKIMRDKYKMQELLQQLVNKYLNVSKEVGGHQQLTEIVDILASITKLALIRPDMWRDVCSTYVSFFSSNVLKHPIFQTTWLLRLACYTTKVVASQVVELLIVAVRDSSVGGQLSIQLADSIIEAQNGEFIEKIIKRFLIGKDEQLRWTLHGMLRSVIQLASRQNQCSIVKKLYNTVYPMVENLGVQGAQLVDLIATYAPRVFSSAELVSMTQSEISTIQKIGDTLDKDGYQGMYELMSHLGLGWKSIQFDRNPCLVCFTSRGIHDVVKMTTIKSDTRYSANTMIYKLLSNYEISKVIIKLSDVKKTKSVESVELKLHPELWRKCAVVNLGENETIINLSLAVPVVTSSLIIEFDEVTDQRSSSQLHCPRCSGPVRTHSGVCDSCGENAFQCMKCRSINYVEKEPFLCQSCGYCKYARDRVIGQCVGALPGAQHITCDAETGQCVQEITQLLTKMETTKTKLTGYRVSISNKHVRFPIEKRDENSCLQALMVLNKYLEATKTVSMDERKKIKVTKKEGVVKWLTSDEDWNDCCSIASTSTAPPPSTPSNPYEWISDCLFSQWMSVRSAANQLLINLSRQQFHEPIALLLLCENLTKLTTLPSADCDQFMSSCHTIIDSSVNTKTRLFVQQFHVYLIRKIHEECANLHGQKITLSTDNTFGERLRCFVELLSLLLSGSYVENVLLKAGADDLLIFLLHSTIFLKRMMTRRTRAIDSSRTALEKLLKRVSCRDGTKLMSVCVDSLKLVKDTSTLGIIVGVMMEIMNPQQETEESFLIQIEKDVAQEDFLQGRMTHNPYNSNDLGMGPLMRDIKNKICRDTEMIALMEDDNGMELLVNGNIISLSLSVREVYDRLWKRTNNGSPMLIVYRMRGLMGDAVETFIENFGVAENSEEDDEEDEQLVRMTNCLTQCGGIDKLMDLMATNVESSSGRFLLGHLRKMFERIVKIPVGRRVLIERRMVERMMSVVRTCCADPTNESKVAIGMELYKVVEFVVSDKHVQDILCGIKEEDANWWFDLFEKRGNEEGSVTELHRKTAQILDQMTSSIGNIVIGSDASENVLVGMYSRILKWDVIDAGVPPSDIQARQRISRRDQTIMMTEQLANITANILPSTYGARLKQKILDSGVIATTCQYLMKDLPNLYQPTESPEWKVFLSQPSLKLILTLLAGLARGHQASQKEIAKTTLKLMHRLEQVASDNSIGTLAENVIEALNEDEEVKNQIKMVRDETEKKKKQMAMMNREKQLMKMRMKVGTGGQIKVSSRTLHNEPSIDDTDSLSCCICRESVIRGSQASGVYAFAAIDQESARTCTVSMMVMVHLDCHKNAIRGGGGGRAVDEWTRSKLHNAGAKCNVITPIAMGTSTDEIWIEAIHRYETDIGRVSGLAHVVVNRNFVFIDICKLVNRFIQKRSFSLQSEGGGRESNMQYLAILHLFGVSLPADAAELEISSSDQRLIGFLFTELTTESWNDQKNDVLRATLHDAQTNGPIATYQDAKPILMTWAFVDAYFNKVIKITGDDRLEWLREHLVETINKTRGFVDDFDSNVLPCEGLAEFCDVTGALLNELSVFLPDN